MPDVLVLCYHAVSDRWPSYLAVTPDQMARQLRFLVGRGYRGATFEQAVTSPPAPRTLAVTFDDGYRSVLTHALPILERLRLPGTVFVPTDFVARDGPMSWPGIERWLGGPHEEELVGMSWQELRSLTDAGWEIGSHTCSHPRVSQLDDDALLGELSDSRRICDEQLGACRSLALPYGDGDERAIRAAEEAGYRAVAGLDHPGAPRSPGWPRVGVYDFDDRARFAFKVARPVRRLRSSRVARRLEPLVRRPFPGLSRVEP
jgi:peptidoglycan/xylan/chitin deacetylase (PgdA/CDA1 family)